MEEGEEVEVSVKMGRGDDVVVVSILGVAGVEIMGVGGGNDGVGVGVEVREEVAGSAEFLGTTTSTAT